MWLSYSLDLVTKVFKMGEEMVCVHTSAVMDRTSKENIVFGLGEKDLNRIQAQYDPDVSRQQNHLSKEKFYRLQHCGGLLALLLPVRTHKWEIPESTNLKKKKHFFFVLDQPQEINSLHSGCHFHNY